MPTDHATSRAGSASCDGSVLQRVQPAVVAASTNAWEEAISAWYRVAASGDFSNLATALISDSARRCGRLEIAAACSPQVDKLFHGSAYLAAHRSQVATLEARRRDAEMPESLVGLEAGKLRQIGAAAVECQMWRFAIEAWNAYRVAGGNQAEACKRLGQCFASLGDHATAVSLFAEAQQLAPDEQTDQKLGRAQRLEARKVEAFARHARRLSDNHVVAELRDGLSGMLVRSPDLAHSIADELHRLSDLVETDLLPLPGAYTLSSAKAEKPAVE